MSEKHVGWDEAKEGGDRTVMRFPCGLCNEYMVIEYDDSVRYFKCITIPLDVGFSIEHTHHFAAKLDGPWKQVGGVFATVGDGVRARFHL